MSPTLKFARIKLDKIQTNYLKQLCRQAGPDLDLRCIYGVAWIETSRRTHHAECRPMAEAIRAALSASRDKAAKGDYPPPVPPTAPPLSSPC